MQDTDWWLMYRHDPQHTGYSTLKAPDNNRTFWIKQFGDWVRSSPAVHNNVVFIGSDDGLDFGKMSALNATTGEEIWSYSAGGDVVSSAAVAYGRVYFGSDDKKFYCVDETNGNFLWSFQTGGIISSSPCVTQNKVVFGSDDYKLYCLNASTGDHLWNYSTLGKVSSSPAVADDKVFFGSHDRNVYALNLNSGTLFWSFNTASSIFASPSVVDSKVFIASYKIMYCLDESDGDFAWSYTTGGAVHSSPAIAWGNVYFGCNDNNLYCLSVANGQLKWKFTTGDKIYSSPAAAHGKVFFGSNDKKVYCLNATSGALIWSYDTGGLVRTSSPAVASRFVYVASSYYPPFSGKLFAFGPFNTAPVATNLAIMPESPLTTDDLAGTYDYYDEEGDTENGTEIRWYKNEVLQLEYNDTLVIPSTSTEKGQQWHFTVRPKDGIDFGTLQLSAYVTVLNSPPSVEGVNIVPDPAYTTSMLTATTYGWYDADGDPEGYVYQWQKWVSGSWQNISGSTSQTLLSSNFVKNDQIKVVCTSYDGTAYGASKEDTITISNTPPTIDSFTPTDTTPEVNEGHSLEFTHTSSDLDDDPLTCSWLLDSVEQSTSQNWTYSPDYDDAGVYNVSLVVSDGELSDSQEWTLTVININRSPVIDTSYPPTDPTISEAESQEFNITYHDPDGDMVSVQWNLNGAPTGTNDSYTFISNYNSAGVHNVTVVISDGDLQASHEWTLTVLNVNRPPTIDSYYPLTNPTIQEGESQEFNITKSDLDGDPLTVAWWLNQSDTGETSDSYTYVANYESAGTYNVTVVVSDGISETSYEWTLTVTNVERDIAITNLTLSQNIVGQGCSLSINVTITNQGDLTETFNATAYYNDTAIILPNGKNYITITLTSGNTTSITFTWNTTGVSVGNYTISAYAYPVPGETDTVDNIYIDGVVKVVPIYTLTITATTGGTTNPSPETHTYLERTSVNVTALPDDCHLFDHWELDGINVGSANPFTVLMDKDHTLHAIFVQINYTLTITTTGGGTTDPVPGTYTYPCCSSIQITAISDPKWALDHWELDADPVGSANPITIHIDRNLTLHAVFTIHDIAVTNLTIRHGQTAIPQNVTRYINVTVTNEGHTNEIFTLTVYWNATNVIGTKSVSLLTAETKILTFTWNATQTRYLNYTLSAVATPVPDEKDTTDNTYVGDTVVIVWPGDVDADKDVDLYDAVGLLKSYGAKLGSPMYEPNMDIDNDGDIDLFDAVALLLRYGYKEP